jgi:hypothetical protein
VTSNTRPAIKAQARRVTTFASMCSPWWPQMLCRPRSKPSIVRCEHRRAGSRIWGQSTSTTAGSNNVSHISSTHNVTCKLLSG